MKITAAVVEKSGAPFVLEEVELDRPGAGEALVRVIATGLCHTDEITRHGDLPQPLPGVLGHEGAGIVEAVGDGVTSVSPGDHVVIGWPSCGMCAHCIGGEPRYCDRLGEALVSGARLLGPREGESALHRTDGSALSSHFFGQSSLATYALTWADALVVVDKDVPLEIVGPLACGISTGAGAVLNTARPAMGDSLVVYGVGAVGLSAVMAARCTPATTIIAVDKHRSRLDLALSFGATHTLDASEDVVAQVHEICGGPATFALECTGVVPVVRQAVDSVGMLGTCILIGGAPAGAEFAIDHLTTLWGKRIIGVLGGGATSRQVIPALLALRAQGRFPYDRLVEYFALDQIEDAIAASLSGEAIKPVVCMPR
ncbi:MULTISPECIES: NAD(P)-dependent alcohol dehydrogenase [Mumia]|uniref:NAD(P)-dependent alcohol dehydrogenase n=1 Tax=Mumia TaxID=1546255 RepID=UPI001422A570|nr:MULTISPECIES: NAD(P)-dependent alcohol dehydrogenase [unclassified Mumia]QMW65542.1 NAD(P)-dependent alcohol dehydrogenase [Mumia sp. ZJ1417]